MSRCAFRIHGAASRTKNGKYHTRRHLSEIVNCICPGRRETNEILILEPCKIPRKQVNGFNMDKDGMSARTIKSQYGKNSVANFIRDDSMGATAVIEYYEQ